MITILHIDTEISWRGGQGQVFSLITRLPRDRFRSILVSPGKSPLFEKTLKYGIPTVPIQGHGELHPGIWLRILLALKKHKPDIIHVHTSHGLVAAALARDVLRNRKLKVVYARRTDFRLRTRFLNISLRKYLWGADRIICVSNKIRHILEEEGIPPERLVTIYSGIDPDRFIMNSDDPRKSIRSSMETPENAKVIGMVAALASHKDPLTFVKSADIVAERRPDAQFWLIGTGHLWDPVREAIEECRHKHRIQMLGFRTDIPEILSALDIFCISSVDEGLCTSILDAMAAGLPVVATRVGGIPEAVADGETGLLVPRREPSMMADAICRLLSDEQLARKMGGAGRERVNRKFHIDKTVAETAAEYERITGKKQI